LALASSLAGHCMFFIWVSDLEHTSSRSYDSLFFNIAITSVILCAILYPLYRDTVHRFLSCFLSQMMILIWLASGDHPNRIYFLIAFQTLGVLYLLAGRSLTGRGLTTAERPLACAVAFGLIFTIATTTFFPDTIRFSLWPAKIMFTAMLI